MVGVLFSGERERERERERQTDRQTDDSSSPEFESCKSIEKFFFERKFIHINTYYTIRGPLEPGVNNRVGKALEDE